jgi:hypothetical protein
VGLAGPWCGHCPHGGVAAGCASVLLSRASRMEPSGSRANGRPMRAGCPGPVGQERPPDLPNVVGVGPGDGCPVSTRARRGAFRHRPKGPEALGPIVPAFRAVGRIGAVRWLWVALRRALQAVGRRSNAEAAPQGSWVLGPPYHCPYPPAVPSSRIWLLSFGVLPNSALGLLLRPDWPYCSWLWSRVPQQLRAVCPVRSLCRRTRPS